MRDKIIGFIISVVCFIISLGFVKGQAMALPFVPTDWTWEMYQGLHMLGDLIANDVNFDIPDWVDFNDFDDVKAFLESIYNEGKKKVAYASIIADMCVGTWNHFLETGEVSLPFSETTVKRTHNTGFFQHIADTISIENLVPDPDVNYLEYINKVNDPWYQDMSVSYGIYSENVPYPVSTTSGLSLYKGSGQFYYPQTDSVDKLVLSAPVTFNITGSGNSYSCDCSGYDNKYSVRNPSATYYFTFHSNSAHTLEATVIWSPSDFRSYNANPESYNVTDKSLTYILNKISVKWRNVNIYVNGTPWALASAGTSIDNPLGVVIPQNVIDEVENGKISGLVIDATLPDTDNLVGSIDLGVVMDELREAQANGRTATLDGVRTKDGVRALDGTVVGTVSKAVAIDVPSTASLVTAADEWGYIPYYPEIPSAFSGTTILSELIDATQTIIPNDLIMAIWGLVIILFIIALINIFHK